VQPAALGDAMGDGMVLYFSTRAREGLTLGRPRDQGVAEVDAAA